MFDVNTLINILSLILSANKKGIKVARSKNKFEKLAATVYRSEKAKKAEVFSVIDTFRASKIYKDAFKKSEAQSIFIIGSAELKTSSFLGAIYRMKIADEIQKPKMEIINVSHQKIESKFVISALGNKPQHVVIGGQPGEESDKGVDLVGLNPKLFDLFKSEFDDLYKSEDAKPMREHISQAIKYEYEQLEKNSKIDISEFVERRLVPPDVTREFKKEYKEEVLNEIKDFVEEILENTTIDKGMKILNPSKTYIMNIPKKKTDIEALIEFLKEKPDRGRLHRQLSIILDLTYFCNLDCEGCGVDAVFVPDCEKISTWELSFDNVTAIMRGISKFANSRNLLNQIRFCIGGGEPTLHPNFDDIVSYASELFGSQNISFDTNGTNFDEGRLQRIAPLVGNIGIGLDGDKEYHDKWRNQNGRAPIESVFQKVVDLLNVAKKYETILNKIEIVFTPTTNNLNQFKDVAQIAKNFGVKRMSCHRFMLTGNARDRFDLEPSPEQYLELFMDIVDVHKEMGIDVHFHHSFEELLSKTLKLDVDTIDTIAPCKTRRASLCISPNLTVHFCPWFVAAPFNKLGVSLTPFLKKSDAKDEKYYDFSNILDPLYKYGTNKCICPIAAASFRLNKYKEKHRLEQNLTKYLLSEDDCEKEIVRLFQKSLISLNNKEN